MTRNQVASLSAFAAILLASCGGDTTGPPSGPSLNCALAPATILTAGAFAILDPTASTACVSLPAVPAAGATGAEYLYVALGTAGQQAATPITEPYKIAGSSSGASADIAGLPSPLATAFRPPATAQAFHHMLRLRERAVAQDPGTQLFSANLARTPSFTITKPVVGDVANFQVCGDTDCKSTTFVTVTATAKHVGGKVAIYLDNNLPSGAGYAPGEITSVGQLFDQYLYPIDTLNFGRESDIDSNGVVKVLLTPAINKLSPNCTASGSVILGYFFANDLTNQPNSNKGEVFYSIVPDPNNTTCRISKNFASFNLAPTFIHEFQHMISFNQHALLRGGASEDTWLNEGLSHYAEELGGRLIPDTTGQPPGHTYTQFAGSDFQNAYEYLANPEASALIESDQSNGALTERGANWLMVRWLADQFGTATDNKAALTVKGTDFTRKLVQTSLFGSTNVAAQTGDQFPDLVTLWQMANYLDDLPGFVPADPRLQYQNLNLRAQFASLNAQDPTFFANPYPLVPDSTKTGAYQHTGTLQQGSGRHVRIIQAAGARAVQFKLTDQTGNAVTTAIVPRVGLVRIR